MKKLKQSIAIAITIILCFSLSQSAFNGLIKASSQDVNSFEIEEEPIRKAPGGVLIDFDDLPSGSAITTHYDDVTFTAAYQVLDTTASPYYPPFSSPNIAYTNDENNNITFDNHVSYVSLYVCTVWDYNIEVVAYTTTDLVIDSVAVGVNVTNQFIEIDVPSGIIHRISLIGDTGFVNYISIDNLFYYEYEPTTHTTITFDDFEVGYFEDSYPGLVFSPGYQTIDTSASSTYPPHSGDMVSYSNELNNWFIFEIPIQKVGFFVSSAGTGYEIVFTAYDEQNMIIEEILILENTVNQYLEFESPFGRVYNISVSGNPGFSGHWSVDTLSYDALEAPAPNLIDFDDLSGGTPVGSNYAGITFTPGFVTWAASPTGAYPPHSGVNNIYSHELMPNITFSFPVEFVSFFICVSGVRNIQVHAYGESGILLQKVDVSNSVKNQYIVLRSLLGMIHRITLVGDTGFESFWTMDDLSYIEYIPGENQLLTFDELATGTYLGGLYGDVFFTAGYQAMNTSTNIYHPPHTGDNVIFSDQANGNITFVNPISYVSFYANAYSDYNVFVYVYNEADVLIQTFEITPDSLNLFVELYSVGGFISKISIIGDSGYENYVSIDTLYFEEYKETFEFLLDFEDGPTFLEDAYPHVIFSAGIQPWNSIGSPFYPPNSGKNVAYGFDLPPIITFTIPIMYTSFLISTPTDYSFEVLAFAADDTLLFKTSVEPDSIDKLIEIYSEDSRINEIRFNGTAGYNTHWTIDNLYYAANMFTYDLDGDGLSYHDEILIGTDPFDPDSDGDGYSDGEEVSEGTDPLNPLDYPIAVPEYGYISLSLFLPFLLALGLIVLRRRK